MKNKSKTTNKAGGPAGLSEEVEKSGIHENNETMNMGYSAVIDNAFIARSAKALADNEEILGQLSQPDGWKFVLDQYSDEIYTIIRKLVYSADEDVIADIFLFAFERLSKNKGQKLKKFKGRSQFKTWLTAVVRNLTRDWVRMKKRRELPVGPIQMHLDKDGRPVEAELEDPDSSAEKKLEESLMFELFDSAVEELNGAIGAMDERSRAVCRLWFFDRLSAKEIAALLGLGSDRDVYQTTGKILKELLATLERKGFNRERMAPLLQYMDA